MLGVHVFLSKFLFLHVVLPFFFLSSSCSLWFGYVTVRDMWMKLKSQLLMLCRCFEILMFGLVLESCGLISLAFTFILECFGDSSFILEVIWS